MRRGKRRCLKRQLDARSEMKMIKNADGCCERNGDAREMRAD